MYIKKGTLQLDFYIAGNSSYDFMFDSGDFRLVNFAYVAFDGRYTMAIEYNLQTRNFTKQTEHLETSAITESIDGTLTINPLPVLRGFKPFDNYLY